MVIVAVLKSFEEEDPLHSSIINFDDDDDLGSLFTGTISSIDDDDPQS